MKWFNFLIYIVLFLMLFTLMGFIGYAQAGFKPEVLEDGKFWLETVSNSLSLAGVFTLSALFVRDYKKLKEKTYLDQLDRIDSAVITGVTFDFPDFVNEFNRKSKINTWKELYIIKLEKHNFKVKQEVLNNIRLHEKNGDPLNDKALLWIQTKEELEERLTDTWIEDNIDYHRISYPSTSALEIKTGFKKPRPKKFIDNNFLIHFIRDRWYWVLGNIMTTALFAAVTFQDAVWNMNTIIKLLILVVGSVLNLITGARYGSYLFKSLDVNNASFRESLLIEYREWRRVKAIVSKPEPTPEHTIEYPIELKEVN